MTIQHFVHNLLQFIYVDLVAPIHYLHYNIYTDDIYLVLNNQFAQHLFDNNYQVVGVAGYVKGWGGEGGVNPLYLYIAGYTDHK